MTRGPEGARYAIVSLSEHEQGGYCPRGGARELFYSTSHETIISGPADTGKTRACCELVNLLLWMYPGAQAVMLRKTYASVISTCLRTYLDVIGRNSPVKPYNPSKPEWYDYPNGSRLWIAGMDNASKVLSAERDLIYVNQAEELFEDDWEILTTRCTGRGAKMPYTRMIADCNPAGPAHWILRRPQIELLQSQHTDNPMLYTDDGVITEEGEKRIRILDALTGLRHKRMRLGLWVQAEGVVYEGWDPKLHIHDRFDIPQDWPRYWSIDFGFTNPFVWQAWALDPDGRLYRYREIYRTQRLVEDHALDILEQTAGDRRPQAIICDHDAEGRATLERKLGMQTTAAKKTRTAGIQAMAARLRKAGDGKPRMFFLRDSLVEPDTALVQRRLPACTEDEFECYIWDTSSGRKAGEEPVDKFNHGMDAGRYMVASQDLVIPVGRSRTTRVAPAVPGQMRY